jgi:UDP-2,3-diacylglucosamine hydrolase
MVVATRVLRHLELYHTPKRCARRLLRSVAAGRLGSREGLTDIFFGHTHVPFSDFTYGGVTFHNTGSCIRKLAFNPVRFRI